jgi:hypothetical protein
MSHPFAESVRGPPTPSANACQRLKREQFRDFQLWYWNLSGQFRSTNRNQRSAPIPILASSLSPIASIIDKIISDKAERVKAKLDLLNLQGTRELQQVQT